MARCFVIWLYFVVIEIYVSSNRCCRNDGGEIDQSRCGECFRAPDHRCQAHYVSEDSFVRCVTSGYGYRRDSRYRATLA